MAQSLLRVSVSAEHKETALIDFARDLAQMEGTIVVGINPNRRHSAGRGKPVRLVQILKWLEYGVPGNGPGGWFIPPRPAVNTVLRRNNNKYKEEVGRILLWAAGKKRRTPKAQLMRLAKKIVRDIQVSILGWTDPPNAESTKRHKGFDDPLVHTGVLARSFEVRYIPARPPASRMPPDSALILPPSVRGK